MEELDFTIVNKIVQKALKEDVGTGDITTNAIIPFELECRAQIIAKEACVVAGMPVVTALFRSFDPSLKLKTLIADGKEAGKDDVIMEIEGKARSILTCERTALNFLQRLAGIATLTKKFVTACKKHRVQIMDTRKTTPLLRHLEKYAVSVGGGENHRIGLYDMFLIKDNHLNLTKEVSKNPVAASIAAAKKYAKGVPVEVEIEDIDQIEEAIEAGADIILFDNMIPGLLKEAVDLVNGRVKTEASGGITLENVKDYAACGVDRISIGALTHSARAVDMSLEIVE